MQPLAFVIVHLKVVNFKRWIQKLSNVDWVKYFNCDSAQTSYATMCSNNTYRMTDVKKTSKFLNKVVNCKSANKSWQCQNAYKSCLLQLLHTKTMTALTQFCDFFLLKHHHIWMLLHYFLFSNCNSSLNVHGNFYWKLSMEALLYCNSIATFLGGGGNQVRPLQGQSCLNVLVP